MKDRNIRSSARDQPEDRSALEPQTTSGQRAERPARQLKDKKSK